LPDSTLTVYHRENFASILTAINNNSTTSNNTTIINTNIFKMHNPRLFQNE